MNMQSRSWICNPDYEYAIWKLNKCTFSIHISRGFGFICFSYCFRLRGQDSPRDFAVWTQFFAGHEAIFSSRDCSFSRMHVRIFLFFYLGSIGQENKIVLRSTYLGISRKSSASSWNNLFQRKKMWSLFLVHRILAAQRASPPPTTIFLITQHAIFPRQFTISHLKPSWKVHLKPF